MQIRKEMEEVSLFGMMDRGIRGILLMGCSMDMAHFIERMTSKNIKVIGKMAHSLVREFNISKMAKNFKDNLNKINFMEMEYFLN